VRGVFFSKFNEFVNIFFPYLQIGLLLCMFITSPTGYAQRLDAGISETGLAGRFKQQLSVFPQEKIYLHTDKPYYISGERIWFRAYIADAATHVPFLLSRYVYVELINPSDSIITRVKIIREEDSYHGHLLIPDNVYEGNYTLRAYTTFMRSQDENYFFTKTVYIGDPQRKNIRISTPDSDFDVAFYPEGGQLMMGASCKMTFKAMKSNGQATHIAGKVYDQDGTEISEIHSDYLGMGSFSHISEKGKTYYLVCENDKGQSKRFDLPVAVKHGYSLSVIQSKNNIYVSIVRPSETTQKDKIYLFAHIRGIPLFTELWNHEKQFVSIRKDQLPSGVLHLILFDTHNNPLSERLVFINNQDQAQVDFQTDRDSFIPRSLVENQASLTGNDGKPLTGNFSVSVTSDKALTTDSTSNILTYLLLSSDLRGYIENPSYYFQSNDSSAWALDLLMCTQGWRRYNIAELAQGRYDKPTSPLETGSEISGTVKLKTKGNKPVGNIEVNLFTTNYEYLNSTLTNQNGRFNLSSDDFPDGIRLMVNAEPKKNRDKENIELIIDAETFPERTLSIVPPAEIERIQFTKYVDMAEKQLTNEGGIRILNLPEVTIKGQRKPLLSVMSESWSKKRIFDTEFGSSIMAEEIENFYPPNLSVSKFLTMNTFPGVSGGKIRGTTQIPGSAGESILYVLNDNRIYGNLEKSILSCIYMHEVAKVTVLKGAEAAIFGMEGAGGAILIYTKTGAEINNREITPLDNFRFISPFGYQQPVEFYSPKYDMPEKPESVNPDLRTTIHWQPVVKTDSLGVASFEFYTADDTTSYSVVIEGLTDDGQIIRHERKILRSGE